MRLKLVPNYNYDPHTEPSALRDNMGMFQCTDILSFLFSIKQNYPWNMFSLCVYVFRSGQPSEL